MKNPLYDHSHIVTHSTSSSSRPLLSHNIIKMMGASMISLFIPAFLYSYIGLSISQIMMFMALMSLSLLCVAIFVGAPITLRYGTKKIMILGTIAFALYLLTLYGSQHYYSLIFLAPLLAGIYGGLFWTAFHYNTSLLHTKNKIFSQIYSNFAIFSNIGIALGPIMGGSLTDEYGIGATVSVAIILVILSTIPLFLYQQDTMGKVLPQIYEISGFRHYLYHTFKNKQTKSIYMTYFGVGYNSIISSLIRPLLIFMFITDFQKIGFIGSLTTITTIALLYYQSRLSKRKFLKQYSIIQGGNWNMGGIMAIAGLLGSYTIIGVDTVQKILTSVNDNTIDKSFFDYIQKEKHTDENVHIYNILIREIGIHGSRIIVLCLLAIIYSIVPITSTTLAIPMFISIIAITLQYSLDEETN